MGKRLRCVGAYVNDAAGLRYEVGQVFDASSSLRMFLMADAPGCFEVVEDKPAVKQARANRTRQVKRAPKDKAVK